MKILFWGTPSYAVPSLLSLVNSGHSIIGVVTQPDRKRSRGNKLIPSPVKLSAMEHGLMVITPENIRSERRIQEEIIKLNADIFIVVACS